MEHILSIIMFQINKYKSNKNKLIIISLLKSQVYCKVGFFNINKVLKK